MGMPRSWRPSCKWRWPSNDKQQITPMVETLGALPEELGEVSEVLADAGYFSEANVATCIEEY